MTKYFTSSWILLCTVICKNFYKNNGSYEALKKESFLGAWAIKLRCGKTGGSGQSGLWVKRVMGQNMSFLNRSIKFWVELGLVNPYFSNNFFFQLQNQINDNLFRENE